MLSDSFEARQGSDVSPRLGYSLTDQPLAHPEVCLPHSAQERFDVVGGDQPRASSLDYDMDGAEHRQPVRLRDVESAPFIQNEAHASLEGQHDRL